ncbi:MAG TPA: cytochrome c-type biogenesis CcmF C-terminal domain-containing protein [Thermoanaerobaculia bacterium]|nr:cytochrome c-type biogenesis CcmF C-terminal domain-containing protein [Thermoanaerobaculia bacterium]
MLPILGRLLILGSLLAATTGAVLGFAAGRTRSLEGLKWARRFAYLYAAFVILATLLMEYALLTHDFSVSYVAQVGSRAVPTWVTVVSLWSSLEGSILFWGFVLGCYVAIATFFTRGRYAEYQPDAIGVWLGTAAFFSFLIAGPASPFQTMSPVPLDGPGPNPLLQNHVLMAIHPPFLYLGYVGMTIPFGFACAALLKGRLGHALLKPLRESLMLPWIFQSIAIMLGGWWAYEVLGWGGYWAWDPVENASFLPWLTATAALHSAIVMERKQALKAWTLTLIMSTFLLVILGTFMTRSGVFNSVHSFTQSSIGPTILAFLAVALAWSIFLLASRIDHLTERKEIGDPLSREGAFLLNNLLLVLFTLTILVGTVFPLIVEAVKGSQMSVGRPYFDRMAVPIGVALLFLMGVGPALPWGRTSRSDAIRRLSIPLIAGSVALAIGLAFGVRNGWTLVTIFFGGYTLWVTFHQMLLPGLRAAAAKNLSIGSIVASQFGAGRRRLGAYVAHLGVVIMIVAIAVSGTQSTTVESMMSPGQSITVSDYELTFLGVEVREESNRTLTIGNIAVRKNGRQFGTLSPAMNQYFTQREPIGSPDVLTRWDEDLYLSIMSIDPSTGRLGLMAIVNPLVGWIWISTGILALGGLLAMFPASRRRELEAAASAPARGLREEVA